MASCGLRRWRSCIIVAVGAAVLACGGAGHTSRAIAEQPGPDVLEGSSDDRLVWAAVHVPGFAGIYYDPYPTLCIALVDPALADAARAEIVRGLDVLPSEAAVAEIRQAKYDFAQLKRWEIAIERGCLLAGLTFFDADEFHNRVSVGVSKDGSLDAVRACASQLGVPPDALEVVPQEPIVVR